MSHTGLLLVLGNWFSYTFGENSEGVAMSVGDTNANTTPGPWNREQYVHLEYSKTSKIQLELLELQ